jgi:hypothetical protein
MDLALFLNELATKGVALIDAEETVEYGPGMMKIVEAWDAIQRSEMAGPVPGLDPVAAKWAAARLFRGCQALVCRELPPEQMRQLLREPCPVDISPSADYTVDLIFRFLPDLMKFARRVSQNDPLVEELLDLGRAWPLSSVGIEGVGEVDASRLLAHPGLRQLYVDRILATGDASRVRGDAVRAAVQTALGAFPELAPGLSAALNTTP